MSAQTKPQKIRALLVHIEPNQARDLTTANRSAGFLAEPWMQAAHRHTEVDIRSKQLPGTTINLAPEQISIMEARDDELIPGPPNVDREHGHNVSFEISYDPINEDNALRLSSLSSGNIKVQVAPNTVFALAGLILVDQDPAQSAIRWRDALALSEDIHRFYDSHQFPLGPHYLNWLSPREYTHYYKLEWPDEDERPYGELAAVHLLAEDLDRCATMIADAGRAVRIIEHEHNYLRTLWVPPGSPGELPFHITQQRAEEWLAARCALTGERLVLTRD